MEVRVQLFAILAAGFLLLVVLELVRRRRLLERYALLWLFSTAVLLGLAVWKNLLQRVASTVGIYYAPSALFVIAFGFILLLLLHFSVVVSRLADQAKILAQRVALLEERNRRLERQVAEAGESSEAREERAAESPLMQRAGYRS